MPAARELRGDRGGQRRLADAALAHRHDHPAAAGLELIDQLRQSLTGQLCVRGLLVRADEAVPVEHPGERVDADRREVKQRDLHLGQAREGARDRCQRVTVALAQRSGGAIAAAVGLKDAVEREHLATHPRARELAAGALGLRQRRLLGAADQHQRRHFRIAERAHARGVQVSLLLQPGQRTQTRHPGRVGIDEPGPCRGQRQQPQRMAGRRGVEDHMVITRRARRIAEQPHERIKRGDLDRARAGQRFLHAGQGAVREQPAVRADHPLAVLARRRLGIDVRRVKTGDPRHRPRPLGKLRAQHLIEIRSRIGGDEQHPPAGDRPARPPSSTRAWSCPSRPCR